MNDKLKLSQEFRMLKVAAVVSALVLSACAQEDPMQFIQEGRALFDKGDMESARVQFKNALQINPKLAEAYYGLALLDQKKPDLLEMRKNLLEVVALDPNHVDAQAQLGLLFPDQMDKAKEHLAVAKKLDPENINTLVLDATLTLREGNKAEALRLIEKVLAKDESNAEAIRLQTFILASDKHYDEALTALNRGIKARPDDSGLGLLKVRVHLEQEKFDEVIRDYEELIAKHPDDKKLRLDQIKILTVIGKPDLAEQALRDATIKDPNDVELKIDLVNFIEVSNPAKAETVLKEFIQAYPADINLKTRLAGYYIGHKRNSDAEMLLKEIVAADQNGKDGLTAKVRLAELAWTQNDKATANQLVEEVINADASNSGALTFRASMRLGKQEIEGAISDLRIVLRDQPNSDQAMIMLAQAYAAKGESEVAQSHWRKALEVNPNNLSALGPLTTALFERGESARAEELVAKSLKASPGNPAMLELLVQARAAQKNWVGAEEAANELKKQPQATLAATMLEGMLAASQGKHAQAIQAYKEILSKKPNAQEALIAMAKSYEASGKRPEFFVFMKTFIKANPSNMVAQNTLGMAYVSDKNLDEAGKVFREALKIEPKSAATYSLLASVLTQQGKKSEAEDVLRKGLEAVPGDSELMMAQARYYEGTKNFPAAIAAYDGVLKKFPANDEAANNLAYLLVSAEGEDANRLAQAGILVERFKASKNPYFLDTYAWVLFKTGKAGEAVEVLKKAVVAVPNNADIHYHLGEAYLSVGNHSDSKAELEKSLALAERRGGFDGMERAKELLKQVGKS
ncbi:MAG: tetratricopeptide repeat protein [Methylomonas sp.]|nr:tetratricopeptide repeat protein [Methylomonas sp.]